MLATLTEEQMLVQSEETLLSCITGTLIKLVGHSSSLIRRLLRLELTARDGFRYFPLLSFFFRNIPMLTGEGEGFVTPCDYVYRRTLSSRSEIQ